MDLTRLKTLAGLNEGQMKHHIEDIAASMELEDFVLDAADYGMGEEEATEFWYSVNGMDEASTVNEAPREDNQEAQFLNTVTAYIRDAEEVAYGDVSDEDIENAYNLYQNKDFAGAAEVILQSFSDSDGGEVNAIQGIYDDMVDDLAMFYQQHNGGDIQEAVGEFAEAYYDLIDRVGGDAKLVNNEALAWMGGGQRQAMADAHYDGTDPYEWEDYMGDDDIADTITRWFSGDDIKEFVDHFERHYDLNSEEEMEEEYTLEAVDVEEEELTEAPTMDTTQLVNLMRNSGMNEEAIAQKLEEWANTPEGVGEVEPTEHGDAYDFAQGVNLSLKRYLDAQDMKVSVNESHTAESLMEAYNSYKGEEIEEACSSKKKVKEEEVEEGNEFSKALADAKKAGKKEFEVDGKKYPVKESEDLAEVGVNDIDDEECDNCGSPLHNGECPQCDADDVNESTETFEESAEDSDISRLRRLSGL